MKHTFIFDMDGVLVDSEPVHYQIMTQVFNELNLNLSSEYRHTLTGMAGIPMWTKIVADCHLPKLPKEYLAFHRELFFKELPNLEVPEVKGIRNLLINLKNENYNLAVASSSEMNLIETFLNRLQIASFFNEIVSGASLERSKPFPDIFLKTAENLKVSPNDCIVLEDSSNGVKAAKAAQMYCIGFQNSNSGNQDLNLADWIVHSVEEISIEKLKNI